MVVEILRGLVKLYRESLTVMYLNSVKLGIEPKGHGEICVAAFTQSRTRGTTPHPVNIWLYHQALSLVNTLSNLCKICTKTKV